MTQTSNPYADLVATIKKAMEYPMPLKLCPVNEDGDACFKIPLSSFAWSNSSLIAPIFRSNAFANLIGEILVRSHFEVFGDVIASNIYPEACKKFKHSGFGLKIGGQDVLLYFHCSFLLQLFNQFLSKELEAAQKEVINIPVAKKKQTDNALTISSFTDDNKYKVTVSMQGNLEHSISTALANIMEHYGVKKDVHTTLNMFSMEIEACDKSKAENY